MKLSEYDCISTVKNAVEKLVNYLKLRLSEVKFTHLAIASPKNLAPSAPISFDLLVNKIK